MNCPICKSKKIIKIHSKFTGYIMGKDYDIFNCVKCNTQFISIQNLDTKIYDIIYAQKNTLGYYGRYYKYAQEVKNYKNPLKFLSKKESGYYLVYQLLKKNRKKLKILEVGCGYGYLTYSLNHIGHHTIGIDISKNAIQYAKSSFGNYFYLASPDNFNTNEKFDLIIATELIEHLLSPMKFISFCINLLNDGGKIVLTTPNRDYLSKKAIWVTDLPPVHVVWLSKKSFKFIAKQNNLNCDFVSFSKYIANEENNLLDYMLSRSNKIPNPVLNKNGKPFPKRVSTFDSVLKNIVKKLIYFTPIKYVSHFCANLISSEDNVLGVILTKERMRKPISFKGGRKVSQS